VTAPRLTFVETRTGDRVDVTVAGDVDLATKDSLIAIAARAIGEGPAILMLNFASVPFLDSTGLAGLIKIRSMCDQSGCTLQLSHLQDHVANVLALTGLDTYLNTVETVDDP
jgi:anti-sigma B factor antagonist